MTPHYLRIQQQLLQILAHLPSGRVTTYGTIAGALGVTPRYIARILTQMDPLQGELLPWHRVIGAQGVVKHAGREEQIARLREEGAAISAAGELAEGALLNAIPPEWFHLTQTVD